jgi:uncharacterized protein Veg
MGNMEQSEFNKVRASVQQQCGSEVMIQLDRGRNKVDIQKGVIQEAYPSVFTILVNDENEGPAQLLSFSYTDIITKEILMKLC